jgi:hypothetical protein
MTLGIVTLLVGLNYATVTAIRSEFPRYCPQRDSSDIKSLEVFSLISVGG